MHLPWLRWRTLPTRHCPALAPAEVNTGDAQKFRIWRRLCRKVAEARVVSHVNARLKRGGFPWPWRSDGSRIPHGEAGLTRPIVVASHASRRLHRCNYLRRKYRRNAPPTSVARPMKATAGSHKSKAPANRRSNAAATKRITIPIRMKPSGPIRAMKTPRLNCCPNNP
jgi:hypothetical protein